MKIFLKGTPFQWSFQYELSYILVPLAVVLYYYFPLLRPILIYHVAIIGFIGVIDTLCKMDDYNGIIITIFSIIFHVALLLVLLDYNKHAFSIYSLVLLLLANIIIVYLPYWPYELSRNTVSIMYNFLFFVLFIGRYISGTPFGKMTRFETF